MSPGLAGKVILMNVRSLFAADAGLPSFVLRCGRVAALLLPAGLLLIAALRDMKEAHLNLWLGTAFQVMVCLLTFLTRQNAR